MHVHDDERGFPPAKILAAVVRNPFLLSRVYGFAGSEHLEQAISVSEESFQAFDALFVDHGREEIPEDEDLVFRLLSIPLYLPGDHIWELEVYDNGEDAGVTHYLHAPGAANRLMLAVHDPQPRLPALRWAEAEAIFEALGKDKRNHASGVTELGPLLLWAVVGPSEDDPRADIRSRLAQAWRHSGLVDHETAERLASASARRPPSPWCRHPELGWISGGSHSLRGEEDGWSADDFRGFNAFVESLTPEGIAGGSRDDHRHG